MSRTWYLWRNEQKWGPYTQEQFQALVNEGNIQPRDLVWHAELADWVEAKTAIKPSKGPPAPSAPPAPKKERSPAARAFVEKAVERMRAADYTIDEDVTWKGGGCWIVANQYMEANFLAGATDCTFFIDTFPDFELRLFADFWEDCRRYALKHQKDAKASVWYFPVALAPRLTERQIEKIRARKPEDYSDSLFTLPSVYEEETGYLYTYVNPTMMSWEARHHEKWVTFSNLICRILLGK